MKLTICMLTNQVIQVGGGFNYPLSFEIEVPISPTKQITVEDGEKQKVNELGELLFKTNIRVDEFGEEVFDEVNTPQKPTKWKNRMVTSTWVDEDGVEHENTVEVREPIEWVDLEPVMIPNFVQRIVTPEDRPDVFTFEDILTSKYQYLLDKSQCDFLVADNFLDESNLDLQDSNHKAHTGLGILVLLPQGQCKSLPIELSVPADKFYLLELDAPQGVDVYIGGKKFVDGVVSFSNPISTATVKFVNTTDKPIQINSYSIGY